MSMRCYKIMACTPIEPPRQMNFTCKVVLSVYTMFAITTGIGACTHICDQVNMRSMGQNDDKRSRGNFQIGGYRGHRYMPRDTVAPYFDCFNCPPLSVDVPLCGYTCRL